MKRKIRYNPTLSIEENAVRNLCNTDAIRCFIKSNRINRRLERSNTIIKQIRRVLSYKPNASILEIARKTKHSPTTIQKYRALAQSDNIPEPGKIKLPKTVTKKTARNGSLRQLNDCYCSHPSCVLDLIREFGNELDKSVPILEPCCGYGHISKPLVQSGYKVTSTDLIDRGFGIGGIDFFNTEYNEGVYNIITNPPYKNKGFERTVEKGVKIANRYVCLLAPLSFISGSYRSSILGKSHLKYIFVYTKRVIIAKNGDFNKYKSQSQNTTSFAWFVFDKQYDGDPILRWILNKM